MWRPSSSRIVVRYFHHISPRSVTSNSIKFIRNDHKVAQNPTFFCGPSTNSPRFHFSSSSSSSIPGFSGKFDRHVKFLPSRNFAGFRCFSIKNGEMGPKRFAKEGIKDPSLAFKNTLARYGDAIALHVEAFWNRNYVVVLGIGEAVVCIFLWRVSFGIANAFIGLSQGMAKYGFLALSSAIVVFTGLYFRSKHTINPDKVYRIAMRRLNTSKNIIDVMGEPLAGTNLRAYVMSGGGITLKNLQPGFRSRRCFLIFPIRGSQRKGLVSVGVKKKKGQYYMKLLAVDIPMASGADQRVFLIGDEEEYRVGGGLISELQDPVIKALAAAKEFEVCDRVEDEEDAAKEIEEAERRYQEEIEKLEKGKSH